MSDVLGAVADHIQSKLSEFEVECSFWKEDGRITSKGIFIPGSRFHKRLKVAGVECRIVILGTAEVEVWTSGFLSLSFNMSDPDFLDQLDTWMTKRFVEYRTDMDQLKSERS